VKFLRYGQHFIEKNGSGVLAFINPHGFLDNPTFRGMRWNLLKTYDKIYILDLHGNSKKKEISPDGTADVNVFDIMQGVSINLFIKTGNKKTSELGKIFHYDLFGKRDFKYDFLYENSIKTIPYKELPNVKPNYFFVNKDFNEQIEYDKGFLINEFFTVNGVGTTTAHDEFVIKEDKNNLLKFYQDFQNSERNVELLHRNFNVRKKDGWNILQGYDNIKNEIDLRKYIYPISYRPFDARFIFYEDKLVWRTVRKVMQHFINNKNLGLIIGRQGQVVGSMPWNLSFITNSITDFNFYYRGGGIICPLYLYPNKTSQQSLECTEGIPNFKMDIVNRIIKDLGLNFTKEIKFSSCSTLGSSEFSAINILDYIYAILHSPNYREKYKEFLKVDFPKIPYPKDVNTFWQLVKVGSKIREIHLFESEDVENYITEFNILGINKVEKIKFVDGKVFINEEQYFNNVPELAWNFYIGGYQPAQKWLKDRKDKILGFEDILHYQKIIVALAETDKLMKEIEKIEF
jgi:predicted helicase